MNARQKFSSQATPEVLAMVREIARTEHRPIQDVLEDALRFYISSKDRRGIRPDVLAHFEKSIKQNKRLTELLAQ